MNSRSTAGRAKRDPIALAVAAILTTALLGSASTARSQPSNVWTDYTALASERLVVGPNIDIFGDFGVVQPGGDLEIQFNTWHMTASPPPDDALLAADSVAVNTKASVNDVFTNSLDAHATATVRGTVTPYSFPIPVPLPPLPAGVGSTCTDGQPEINVTGTTTLPPGCYGQLTIQPGATLNIANGIYIFRRALVRVAGGIIVTSGGVELDVQDSLLTDDFAEIGPLSMNPNDLGIWIGGAQNKIGEFNLVVGTVFAPADNGFDVLKGTNFAGTIYAGKLHIRGTHTFNDRTPTPTPPPTPTPTPTSSFIPPTPTPTSPPSTPTPTPPPGTPTPTPPPGTPTPTPPPGTPTPTPPPGTPTPTPPPGTPTPTPPPGTPTPTPPPGTPTPTPPPGTPTPFPTGSFVPPTPTPTSPPSTPTPTSPPSTPTPFPTQSQVVPTPTPTPGPNDCEWPPRRLKGKPWGRQFFVGNPITNYANFFMRKPLAGTVRR